LGSPPAFALSFRPPQHRSDAPVLIDPLTGLGNHRALHERLRAELAACKRYGHPLALAVIDVDRFKAVNDAAGHVTGDLVLTAVARQLRRVIRAGDALARIGGDEFAVVFTGSRATDAFTAVERARTMVKNAAVADGLQVTVSAGICDLAGGFDTDSLFRHAHGALHWSKLHGRDATWIYDPLIMSAIEGATPLERSQALLGIRALARAIDAKDPGTRRHSERVASLARRLAAALDWTPERIRLLEETALVHDVGKIGVPDAVLLKPGRLDPAEYEIVKQHAVLGAEITADVLGQEQVDWIRGHHERPDGRGYPDGLAGDQISDGARILSVADAFDVMTMARPYSPPKNLADALAECEALIGRQFAPEPVHALRALLAGH
jgi:diguanylate cyclase (GGDEF)-like protein